jgi:hypothetical protein
MQPLSIIALGDIHAEALMPLGEKFNRLEQLVLDVNPRHPLSQHRAEFNRAVDAASADWILIVRERETVTGELAHEIGSVTDTAKAWGFRIRVQPFYAGAPLLLATGEGEVRLFHKRHYMRFADKGEWAEPVIQGTIVRLGNAFRAETFPSVVEHRAYLEKTGVPHSGLRRVLLFLRDAVGTRTVDRNTLRYIWTEAGFDKS